MYHDLFIYIFHWCFNQFSKIFHLYDGIHDHPLDAQRPSHVCSEGKPARAGVKDKDRDVDVADVPH